MSKKILTLFLAAVLMTNTATAQPLDSKEKAKIEKKLRNFFEDYKAQDTRLEKQPKLVRFAIDDSLKTVTIHCDKVFAQQDFSPKIVSKINKKIAKLLSEPYDGYAIEVIANGMSITDLIPNHLAETVD